MELIEDSDSELKKLERSLKLNGLQQDDLRYALFKMITDILHDNISVRLENNQ